MSEPAGPGARGSASSRVGCGPARKGSPLKPTKPLGYLQGNARRSYEGRRALTIQPSDLNSFRNICEHLCNRLVMDNVRFDWDDYLLAYMTPDQVELCRQADRYVNFQGYVYRDEHAMVPSGLADGLYAMTPGPHLTIEYRSTGHNMMPRSTVRMNNRHSAILKEAEDFLVQRAFEVGNLKLTLEFLMQKCASVEAMRYLFPPTLWFLREAGLHNIANKVEDVAKRPVLPAMRADQRWRLREVNRWWTVRLLMDDLGSGIAAPDLSGLEKGKMRSTISFDANFATHRGNLSPRNGEEPGQEWLFFKSW